MPQLAANEAETQAVRKASWIAPVIVGTGIALGAAAIAQDAAPLRGSLVEPELDSGRSRAETTIDAASPSPTSRPDDQPLRTPSLSAPAAPVEGDRTAAETNPFEPLGIRTGSATFFPTVEQGIGWRKERGADEASLSSETTFALRGRIENDGHTAGLDGTLAYRRSLDGPEIDEWEGDMHGEARFRLGSDYYAAIGGGYAIAPESATSPVIIPDVVDEPLRQTFDISVEAGKDLGPARFSLRGATTRQVYDDAELTGGGTLSQAERDSTLYAATLRGGYALSPVIAPFAEVEIGRRIYDERLDSAGFERSADRFAVRAGIAYDRGEKLSGELAAGWLTERPDDDRLQAVSGLDVAAAIQWSPIRGTIVGLDAGTTVEATTDAGASGSILYTTALSLSRELRHDLTGDVSLGLDYRDYSGSGDTDLTWRADASLTWWMNRHAGIVGRISWEDLSSTIPGRDRSETSLYLGLRAQR